MFNIYTGYFAKVKHYEMLGYTPVAIVASKPKWFEGLYEPLLAPCWALVSDYKLGLITEEDYIRRYTSYLDTLDIPSILNKYSNCVLCCYEKFGDFCHRHILANYLRDKYGIVIIELRC